MYQPQNIRWYPAYWVVLLISYTAISSENAVTSSMLNGYSQWSDLIVVDRNGEWNFLNESANVYEIGSTFNCSDPSTATEKCPTALTVAAKGLNTIPNKLFANTFRRLSFLNLSNCNISFISNESFRNADHLIELILSWNQIAALPANLFEFASNIEVINLSNNHISASAIDVNAFAECSSLRRLDVGMNPLRFFASDEQGNWLSPLTNLEVLNVNVGLDYRNVRTPVSVFYENTNLISLFAVNRNIRTEDGSPIDLDEMVTRLPKLRQLITPGNVDEEFNLDDSYNNVTILNVTNNFLDELSIPAVFEVVVANHNRIRSIDCAVDNKIIEIHLSGNRLFDIDFVKDMPHLEYADFSFNYYLRDRIGRNLVHLKNLTHLNLSHCREFELDLNVMQEIASLKFLDVSHKVLPFDLILHANSSIEEIRITENSNIKSITVGTKKISIIQSENIPE